MNAVFAPAALLIFTVATLAATRRRGPIAKAAAGAALLAAIGVFLTWRGAAPSPGEGGFPAGFDGVWLRGLAAVWWLVGARLAVSVVVLARGLDSRSRDARLFSGLVAAMIYVAAVLVILNSVLGLPIKGLLATSGVIAIVLGLALQNTLADVFSGIAVGLERPFHVGDRVSLGDNEGVIVQIVWRSIRIRTDGDDVVTIPNSIVAKGQIINRSVPTSRRAATVEVMTSSEASPETVLELMRQAALLCPNVLADPAPMLALRRFGVRTSTYAATFFVSDSPTLLVARSLLLRQMRRVFHHAGVNRCEPVSAVELLGSLVIFEALSPAELQTLAGQMAMRVVEPGDTVFEQGSTGASIYVVQAGVLETVRQAPSGSEEAFGRIGPGEYIGELGLITGVPRGVTMRALTHGRVLELPGDSLAGLLASNAALNAAMEKSVRKGLALLDRDSAARSAQPGDHATDLLARIRTFFGV